MLLRYLKGAGEIKGTTGIQRRMARLLPGALLAAVALLAALSTPALAEDTTHVFDPTLSLTGTCLTSKVDEVADPGCPGGMHPGPFEEPVAVTTDAYGDIYLATAGKFNQEIERFEEGRIDIFDPTGRLITSVESQNNGPANIAVDKDCNLYVVDTDSQVESSTLHRYVPSACNPAARELAYESSPVLVADQEEISGGEGSPAAPMALAINPLNQHLFLHYARKIVEYSAAGEGSEEVERFGSFAQNVGGSGLAINARVGSIYVTDFKESNQSKHIVVKVLELAAPHSVVGEIDGSTTPTGAFLSLTPSVAVDEGTGNVFVYDGNGAEVVYEFTADGGYVASINHELQGKYVPGAQIAVDNGAESPNGGRNPFGRYLFVPAFRSDGHLFAFGQPLQCAPEIVSNSFSGVSSTEALLEAQVNPCFLATTYALRYTTLKAYENEGFGGAALAGEGRVPAGGAVVGVSAQAEGLTPGTTYRFQVMATNSKGSSKSEGEFATYASVGPFQSCPNDVFRTGASSLLPDCRAYELVTPPATNTRTPNGIELLGPLFTTREASPDGEAVSFSLEGGALPGNEGTGSFSGDPYLVRRTESGWHTTYSGPSAAEAPQILPGSNSPDQGYALWSSAGGEGSANVEGKSTNYLRYPDGHSAFVGRGTLGVDPFAQGRLISQGGGHVIFNSDVRLQEEAPAGGTSAVYDRTLGEAGEEVTHVVSLLPGSKTPAEGEDASFVGTSLDGNGVAFTIGSELYLRSREATFAIGEGLTFSGIAGEGTRIFYLQGKDLYRFDAATGQRTRFTTSGDVTPVNVAAAGTVAYFVSPTVLAGEENSKGAKPIGGEENLYRSEEGHISFLDTLTDRDVEGEKNGGISIDGLGLWVEAVGPGLFGRGSSLGRDPSRTTGDGGILLFESRAHLTGYDSQGNPEIYRYDFATEALECLSCTPTLAPAVGTATLESASSELGTEEPFSFFALVENLSADGRRVAFQSTEALVAADNDGLQDIYEWEARGVGSCNREDGCLFLVSSGHSAQNDYLYAVSDSGDDIFFRTGDLLLESDREETPSIYDARVGGGFLEVSNHVCEGEGCKPALTPPPSLTPSEIPSGGSGNARRACPRGRHRVRRHGKARCIKKHRHKSHHKHHQRKAGSKKREAVK